MTDTVDMVLDIQTIIRIGPEPLNKYLDCIFQLKAWVRDHGTPDGFRYPPQATENWWDGKNPRFDCWAKPGARIMKVPAQDGFTQAVGAEPVYRTMKGGEHMDVFEVWRPGGWPPDWFIVLKTEIYWLVCLASETTEAPPTP